MNGADALPAVPHRRLEIYQVSVDSMTKYPINLEQLPEILSQSMQKKEYHILAEFALAGSAFFLQKSGYSAGFERLQAKLKQEYRPYSDKGRRLAKWHDLNNALRKSLQNIRNRADPVQTAKALFELADCAVKLSVEDTISSEQSQESEETYSQAYG